MFRDRTCLLRRGAGLVLFLLALLAGTGPVAGQTWTELDEQRMEHQRGILNGAVSHDGKLLASTCVAHVRLWDVSGKEPRELSAVKATGGTRSAAFFPDDKRLAVGFAGNIIRLYDIKDGKLREAMVIKDNTGNVNAITFSPDGKTMVTGSDDMTLWFYDVTGAKPKEKTVFKIEKAGLGVKALHFQPDGKRLIVGCGNGAMRLLDVTGSEPKEIGSHKIETDTFLFPAALTPDGKTLAAGSKGEQIKLFDVLDNGFKERTSLKEHSKKVRSLAMTADGRYLASTGSDGKIMLWEMGKDKPLWTKQRPGEFADVEIVPDGKEGVRLAAFNWNSGTIYVFRLGPGKP
jgi:WD40 repeat protein